MKTKIGILVLALSTSFFSLQAQRTVTTARATSYDISDNLDLDAVASIFGDSENLEDFERRLNDPDNRISNLDLNEDGYIDYLRVLENSSDRNSLTVIQAVLAEDVFQDVATIEIERVRNGNPRVQIVGDAYIYGSDYIIEPRYVHTPSIFSFFWSPRYITYRSPYYWNYYPSWYSYYRPYSTFRYHRNVYVHINRQNTYHRTSDRHIYFSGDNYNQIRRNDYATRHPSRAFVNRNEGLKNRNELNERRPNYQVNSQRNEIQRSNNSRSNSGSNERQKNVIENKRRSSNVQQGTIQTRTRDNSNVSSNRKNSDSSNGSVQMKSGTRNEGSSVSRNRSTSTSTPNRPANQVQSTKRTSDSRSQSISRPTTDRSTKRVESVQRSSAPREKSGSVSGQSRSNREVRQNTQSVRKSESPNTKESEGRRRR